MSKKTKDINQRDSFYIFARYLLLLFLSFGSLYIFYLIFTPLTIYPVLFILKLIYGPSTSLISTNTILVEGISFSLIPACIAGAAYYLLLILNLSTPISIKIRLKSIIFLYLAFLLVNISRIAIFSILAINSNSLFNQLHIWTWYLGSTAFVIILWFVNIKLFKIKSIPIYSDFKTIISSIKK